MFCETPRRSMKCIAISKIKGKGERNFYVMRVAR
jgi:hypothetical protein